MSAPTVTPAQEPAAEAAVVATALEPSTPRSDRDLDHSVSFPELVWAHFQRQNDLLRSDGLEASCETEYRRRLKRFKQQEGDIISAYWCRYEASGAALTDKEQHARFRPWRRSDSILRLHTATDWRTHEVPEIADLLHTCDTLAIKVGEVLRGTSERIALQWILSVASRCLGAIDQEKTQPLPNSTKLSAIVRTERAELQQIERYYHRAGHKAARLVYFTGMMRGVALLIVLGGLIALALWPLGVVHAHGGSTQNLFISGTMGALGAVISVMSRMATAGRFQLDHEVGRKQIRRLGSFRPFIGAVFAVVLYLALKSNLLQIGNLTPSAETDKTIYFYATIGFLAGFSERWAKVLLDNALGGNIEGGPSVTGKRTEPDEAPAS